VFSAENARDGVQLVVRKNGVVLYRFASREGRLIGVAGHHHGEAITVVRREDGSVSHLDLRTFVFTRTPYDPDVPVPGGHPGR
jgi:D-alanyl-D-alanine carboxypeptidase